MSVSLSIQGFASKNNPEFQKHYNAVVFCIENNLSFPKETSEFFKGKIGGDDLEDVIPEAIMKHIENGVEIELTTYRVASHECHIKVADIPTGTDTIIVKLV